jgi:hypothetical protein
MTFLSIHGPLFIMENTPESWWADTTPHEVVVNVAANKQQPTPKDKPKEPQKVEDPAKIKQRLDEKFKEDKETHPEMWDVEWIKKASNGNGTYKIAEF